GAQLGLDLVIGGQRLGVGCAQAPGRLALGEREVVDSVLGHDPRRGGRDSRPHSLESCAVTVRTAPHRRDNSEVHLHILGICGTFMGGIAAIAKQAGHRVTGCDANVYPPMSDQLRSLGIELLEGYDETQIKLRPDMWVIGNVVTRGNPLMEAILDRGERYVSGPQWLADHVLTGRHVLAIAGTHGKTTVSR